MALKPLNLRITANTDGLDRGLKDSVRNLDGFKKRTQETMVSVARATTIAVGAFAALGGGILAAANQAAQAGTEIRNLSAIAGTGTTQFQKYAAASRTIGIEQEKLADIFKDVNDKFGDYMATGAGPLADFFENIAPKIGVTADQFARLSGPEALQLYVTSLERAGVSQQQMTFYMEALASDATALVPLLANGGQAMRDLGDEAERAGRILSEDMIANAVELDRELGDLAATLRTQATAAVLEHKEELVLLVGFITDDVLPALSKLVGILADSAEGWRLAGEAASNAISPMLKAMGILEDRTSATFSPEEEDRRQADVDATNQMGGGDTSNTGLFVVDDNGNIVPAGMPDSPSQAMGTRVYSGRGSVAGPSADEALQAYLESRREGLAQVEEIEEQHAGRMREIQMQSAEDQTEIAKTTLERILQIQALSNSQRLSDLQGAFGDLSSLMRSENDKLFKIGQAAALAQATVSGYQAAVDAWQKGMKIGGPPVAAAFTAASLAKTGALIGQISSASSRGRSGGGAGGGGGGDVTAGAGSSPQTQNVTIDLVGATGTQVDQFQIFADTLNEAARQGLLTNLSVRGV